LKFDKLEKIQKKPSPSMGEGWERVNRIGFQSLIPPPLDPLPQGEGKILLW